MQVSASRIGLAPLVRDISNSMMKKGLPTISIGDTVKVGLAVVEGTKEKAKTRTQTLEGTIIAEHGQGLNKTMTFRRVFQGVGMELILPIHAPVVQSMDVVRHGRIRRSKLYYLRQRVGKSAKLKEIVGAAAVKRAARVAAQQKAQKAAEDARAPVAAAEPAAETPASA